MKCINHEKDFNETLKNMLETRPKKHKEPGFEAKNDRATDSEVAKKKDMSEAK